MNNHTMMGSFPERTMLFLCMWDNTFTEIHSRKTLWHKYRFSNLFVWQNESNPEWREHYAKDFADGNLSEEDFDFDWQLANPFGNPCPKIEFRFLDEVLDFLSLDKSESPHGMPSQWTLTYVFRNDNMTIRRIA